MRTYICGLWALFLYGLLLLQHEKVVAQFTSDAVDTGTSPIIPVADVNSLKQSSEGMLPKLEVLQNRMSNAYVFGKDSVPFKPKIIRYRKNYDQYHIWIYEANMIIRHRYTKDCRKKSITKDCSWEEIDIPYSFIDSIRSVLFSRGYVIYYRNILAQPSKFKVFIGKGEINFIAKTIKDEAKKKGVKLDSTFSLIYQDSWETRVNVMLRLLNKLGLKKVAGKDIKKMSKQSKSALDKITMPSKKTNTKEKDKGKSAPSSNKKDKKNIVPKPDSKTKKSKNERNKATDSVNISIPKENKKPIKAIEKKVDTAQKKNKPAKKPQVPKPK